MSGGLTLVEYGTLNARQKENDNFHKVAARLADFGYTSLRLTDDFEGADFVALHVDGETILRVQIKSRLTLNRKYPGKGIHIAFRLGDAVFLYPHDGFAADAGVAGRIAGTSSWDDTGTYTWPHPPKWALSALAEDEL